MRILILGAGKMGSFFTDVLSFKHETAVFDVNPQKLRFMYNCYRFTKLEEIEEFRPELVINAATVKYEICGKQRGKTFEGTVVYTAEGKTQRVDATAEIRDGAWRITNKDADKNGIVFELILMPDFRYSSLIFF